MTHCKISLGNQEVLIDQCPDLEKMLVATCRAFAKCDIGRDPEGFGSLMNHTMSAAIEWQKEKGSKATYRKIEYNGMAE